MILLLLLNIHQQWMISLKTLKITTKKRKRNVLIVFDDMISHVMSKKSSTSS